MPDERDELRACEELRSRLDNVERRLDAIEELLSALAEAPGARLAGPESPRVRQLAGVRVKAANIEPPPLPTRPVTATGASAPPTAMPVAPPSAIAPPVPRPAKPRLDLEKLIGGRWFAWIGAIIVVVGIGLFVRYAYDQGWLRVAPVWRCAAGCAFGLALLGAGEVLRRRVGPTAATGVVVAGIGSLFASVYAAYRLYALVPPAGAFAMLAVVCVGGVLLAARVRLVAVGFVSLVAGYAVPVLISSGEPSPVVFPAYLLLLLGFGLVLSGWLGGRFELLRTVAWWGTLALGGLWVLGGNVGPERHAAFLVLFWIVVHAELVWSARRGFAAPRAAPDAGPRRPFLIRVLTPRDAQPARPYVTSFATTAFCVALGVVAVRAWRADLDWLVPACGFVAASLGALLLGGMVRPILDRPENDAQRLGACLAAQGGVLLLLCIGLGLSGWAIALSWTLVGVGAVLAGVWLRARPLVAYGCLALGVGTVRVLTYDAFLSGMNAGGTPVYGVVLNTWSQMVLMVAAAWIGAGVLMRGGVVHRAVMHAAVGIGLSIAPACLLTPAATPGAIALGALLAGCVMALVGRQWGSRGLAVWSVVLLLCGSFATRLTTWWERPPLRTMGGLALTLSMVVPVCCAGAWCVRAALVRGERGGGAWMRPALLAPAFLFACGAIVHEQSDVGSMAWVWLALACALALLAPAWTGVGLAGYAAGGLALSTLAWSWAYARTRWLYADALVLLHPGLLLAGAIAAVAMLCGRAMARRSAGVPARTSAWAAWTWAGAILLAATSFEVARIAEWASSDPAARGGALSIWWAVAGVGAIASGFARHVPILRHVGLGIVGVAAAKIVAFDLASVSPGWRIASFIGVGMLMLIVAVAYAKLARRAAEHAQTPAADPVP